MRRRLVRDVISSALGSPSTGFFCKPVSPVSQLSSPLNFGAMSGEADYKAAYKRVYDAGSNFLTPCELFAPWYSHGIAQWILEQADSPSFTILEFGGGHGTNASRILDYVKSESPRDYDNVKYVDVDVSEGMVEVAQQRIRRDHPSVDFQGVVGDACSVEFPEPKGRVFALALELLDNLPHDKIRWYDEDGHWMPKEQVEVDEHGDELSVPLTDAWIRKAATVTERRGGPVLATTGIASFLRRPTVIEEYVPTGALQLFKSITDYAPDHRLLVADFDDLPRSDGSWWTPRKDINAPIVATKEKDFDSYLDALGGEADIFFATDFPWLAEAYRDQLKGVSLSSNTEDGDEEDGVDVNICKSSTFFRPYAAPCTTKSGYNPLLSDFSNTSVLFRGRSR